MTNVTVRADKSSRPSFIPPEPAMVQCDKCMCMMHKGEPRCPVCHVLPPRPKFRDFGESDAWFQQQHKDILALQRWKTWDRRQKLKTVPPSHPRYAAWMALRCYLQGQCYLRPDADMVAHIAAVLVLSVERREGNWWFGDLLMDDNLGASLYAPENDDKDHGMAGALLSLWALLVDPVGSRDDILPGDHAVIVGAFE